MLPPHLGGHLNRTHVDSGSLAFMRDVLVCHSMVDVGCGPGGMVECAIAKYNMDATGIDGDYTLHRSIPHYIHDYTTGKFPFKHVDVAWSVEFLEHIEEQYIPNAMSTFQCATYVICTAAPPGKPGHHHVNCKSLPYWIAQFDKYGFIFDQTLTNKLKHASTMDREFIRETGMVFRRRDTSRRLHVGCGSTYKPWYEHNDIHVSAPFIDWKCDPIQILVADNTYAEIYARHWLEHLRYSEARKTIKYLSQKLQSGGYMYIIVPNLLFHAKQLFMSGKSAFVNTSNIEHAMAGFYGWGSDNPYMAHMWGYTPDSLTELLRTNGGLSVHLVTSRECDIEVKAYKI